MTTTSHKNSHAALLVAAAIGSAALLAPSEACAQEAEADNAKVSNTGKGITGGALLGAEVVMIPIAIAGVKAWWPYVVFGAVGAGAGAVGGWAVEKVDAAEPSLYMLAGGMALVVPTIVAVLNATAYDPAEEVDEEGDKPDGAPGDVEAGVEVETGSRPSIPMSLIGVDAWSDRPKVNLGVPAIAVQPRFTDREVAQFGQPQATEVRIPLVSGTF